MPHGYVNDGDPIEYNGGEYFLLPNGVRVVLKS